MSILDTRISVFKSTTDIEVVEGQIDTIGYYLKRFQDGYYAKEIEKLRSEDESSKPFLPTIAFHGLFNGYRKKDCFIEASGIIILDIDDVEESEIEEIKCEIFTENESILAVMTSPSGNGIKVLYYVDPELVNADNYRQIGKQLVSDFDTYGDVDYLSITDCLIVTHDINILVNENAVPAQIYVTEVKKKEKVDLEPLDENRKLWEDAEDFFDTVLANDIAQKTSNNYHYIQIAVFDLKKFGFEHPELDLTFVIDYAEEEFKYSRENKKRFLEVVNVAKQYSQTVWPYRVIKSKEPDDEYQDYSKYAEDDVEDEEKEVTDFEGLINYDTFFDKVIKVVKEGDRIGFETSHKEFGHIFRFKGTGILTVTGIPTHGKTEYIDSCILDLARLYGHETLVAGFEQTPEEHVIKLIRKLVGTNVTCKSWFNKSNEPKFKNAYNFVTSKIKHVDTDKSGGNVNEILEVCAKRIKRSRDEGGNPKYLVLDPFNMLSIKGKFSGHEKIEEILRRLAHFSKLMNVMIILVAHPFKMRRDEKTGVYAIPDFYSVKGSSAFFEMSYHGLVVYRPDYGTNVLVKVLKVKQNNLGQQGAMAYFDYEKNSGRYIPVDEEANELSGDHNDKDWLEKALELDKKKLPL